jgi:hypothetical protein
MSSNSSSSIVISFSIAILLLLTLLLLISYNSKCKMENIERFENENGLSDAFDSTNMFNVKQTGNYPSVADNANKLADVKKATDGETIPNVRPLDPTDNYYGTYLSDKSGANADKINDITQLPPQTVDEGTYLNRDRLTSSDLLPKDAGNSKWAEINPAGTGDIRDQNFLTAGYHIGINTIGQSLRNANLQLRSEPPNPQVAVSPWGISTIEPDVRTVSFEIGSTPTNN